VVTEVTGHGSIRRGVLDTAGRSDAGRLTDLIERAALDCPPPYRPVTGMPLYEIRADDKTVWVAERDLVGPLRELVITTLAEGEHPSPLSVWPPPPADTEADDPATLPAAPGRDAPG
jgi:hypothetical protein